MKNCKKIITFALLAQMALLLVGCAGSVVNMREVPEENLVVTPEQGKALIVFMRPSGMGFAVQSSVFEMVDGKPSLVGIVAAKKKVAYQAEPGSHLFMAVGESGDFMSAEVEAGKTYHALVTPRMGAWKARFSLRPVTQADIGSEDYQEWMSCCAWVEKTAESDQWARDNLDSIQSKYDKYYPKWMEKAATERPKLLAVDGQ